MDNNKAIMIFESLIKSINEQWDITNIKINLLSDKIECETKDLQNCTAAAEEVEKQIRDQDQSINELNSQIESTNSEITNLNNLITSNNNEIEECNEKIKQQQSHNVVLDVLNHIFNPIGSVINDIVFTCTNTIKELSNKINHDKDEITTKTNIKLSLENKVEQYKNSIIICKQQSNLCNERRLSLENEIKKLGIEKTQNGTLQINLEKLRTRLKISLDNTNQDKELLDIDINMVEDSIKEVKDIYNSNGISFDFNFNFIDEASIISQPTHHHQPTTETSYHFGGFYMTAL